ncbi:MAG: PSD1 and planctomycete cytochrome C domain-containing protein [Verrucomicrobiota bacterium]
MTTRILTILTTITLGTVAHAATPDELTDTEKGERLFSLHVGKIISQKCTTCHGDDPDKIKGDFDMTSLEGLLKGGETIGKDVLVPGSPAASFLLESIEWKDPDFEMPPKENDRLDEDQIQKIRRWIALGAPWPDEATRQKYVERERTIEVTDEGRLVETSGGTSDDWTYRRYEEEGIWAFQPLTKPDIPKSDHKNPVDAFIAEKRDAAGFKAAPKADPRTLIRRATYDLTGLPPTPREVFDFTNAYEKNSHKAWNDLIDRLLASPHYGERWAQHWLDVARYADTAGMSNDYERSNAWRYRDYVIRSINDDKPYNQFIVEQLAGDELADQSLRQRIKDDNAIEKARTDGDYTPEESELLVASSFLRMGPWDGAMVKAPEARQLYIDDTLNAIGQTFLSTTMRCFKCHDHKFDPLPTRDYYRMYSALAGTQMAERKAPFLNKENMVGFEGSKQMTEHLHNFAKTKLDALKAKNKAAANKWREENGIPKVKGDEEKLKGIPDDQKPPRHIGLTETEKGRLKVRNQDEWIWNRRLERYQPLVQSVYNGPDSTSKQLSGRSLRMKPNTTPDWRPVNHILSGGALEAPTDPVTPGVMSALGIPTDDASADDPYRLTKDLDGRRLGLAKWIAHPENPLTTRSIVNRIWQYHFGKAIAGNPNNFGVSGKRPTHPELINWLAADFVENGWTMKRLHRLIMQSETYQQAATHPDREELAKVDAFNDLFAFFPSRRLGAEEIRDSMLQITGELNREAGGLPIKPEINMEVALQPRMIQFSLAPAWQPSRTPQQRNRRSIYAYRVRGLPNPFLETFNQPNPNDSCEERDAASVSPQAFTLLNSDVMTDRSIALALRVEKERDGLEEQVKRVVQLAFNRVSTNEELEKLTAYVEEMRVYHKNTPAPEKEYPTHITRYNVEEFSGQPFDYQEILPVFNNYVPDKKAADVNPNTRALADLCLVLFNSNEFMYVY